MSDILEKIVATKKIEIANISKQFSLVNQRDLALENNQSPALKPRGFINSIYQEKIPNIFLVIDICKSPV